MTLRFLGRSRRMLLTALAGTLLSSGVVVAGATPLSAAPRSTPPALDAFLCYTITAPAGWSIPRGLQLGNAIQTPIPYALFSPQPMARTPALHCNPATTRVTQTATSTPEVTRAQDPAGHLLCWQIGKVAIRKPVVVTNQFGTSLPMVVEDSQLLCVPTWKNRHRPPHKSPSTPPGLDHFTCYEASPQSLWDEPHLVRAFDEFSAPTYQRLTFPSLPESPHFAPHLLCFPTLKVVSPTQSFPPQTMNDLGLACWIIGPTTHWGSWYDENQFGTGRVTPIRPHSFLPMICLPSTIQVSS
jgi:hypothetical protein